ncbi:MAG: hypothetical protein JXA21_22480 [Anaerolineae bacterium]|nr:hypothetical protein [Anaerolineae bacterium]
MPPNWLWGYWLPVGLLLLAWGGLPAHKARRVTSQALFALALGTLGYWAVGFGFHLGGAHAVNPNDPTLLGLDMLYAPSGADWGLLGLKGFFLTGKEVTATVLALFLAYLPLVASAVLLVTLALSETRRWFVVLVGILIATVIVPVAACWMWGSGWLAHLGITLTLGHGFVDFGGSALVLWLPGMVTLGILLQQPRREPESPSPPATHHPLMSNLGALILGIGWTGWSLSGPFHTIGVSWDPAQAAVNVVLGMAGAVLTAQLYAWLTTGDIESLLAARGIAAGWGATLAAAPFLQPWAALMIGLLAGLTFSFLLYATEAWLRLRDMAATVAIGLTGGLWGLLSVGIFADGLSGQGWNNIGAATGNGEMGIAVTGFLVNQNWGQFKAQLVGLLVIGLWGLLWGVLLGFVGNPGWIKAFGKPMSAATPEASAAAVLVNQESTHGVGDGLAVSEDKLTGAGKEAPVA